MQIPGPEPVMTNDQPISMAKKAGRIGTAIVINVIFTLGSAAFWAYAGITMGFDPGWLSFMVGGLSAVGVIIVAKGKSLRVGFVAAIMAAIGLVAGKFMIAQWSLIYGGKLTGAYTQLDIIWFTFAMGIAFAVGEGEMFSRDDDNGDDGIWSDV